MGNNTDIICRQISKEKRIRLIKTDLQNIFSRNNCYAGDESGNITGLNLSGQVLKNVSFLKDCRTLQWLDLSNNYISDLSMLTYLKNLTKLDISHNRITDISCLRELKKLSWVNLRNNKITTLPRDILEWGMEIKWESEHSTDIILHGNPLEKSLRHAIENGRKALIEYFEIYVEIEINTKKDTQPEKPKEEVLPGKDKRGMARRKILILGANPIGSPRLNHGKEVREIQEGLQLARYRDYFEIYSKGALRVGDLQKALLYHEPHIVHFSGHGNVNGLWVEDEIGSPARISSDALSGLFKLFSNQVECVVLCACYSEPQAEAINEHIPYVVGMRKEISDNVAIVFAVGFYDALGAGWSVEKAFELGCNAIQLKFPDLPEHLIPVLKKRKE